MPQVTLPELRKMLVENCVLKVNTDEITAETRLFGPESIGLDSLDALQMTVAIEKQYGIPITDPALARRVLRTLGSLQEWLAEQPSPAKKG